MPDAGYHGNGDAGGRGAIEDGLAAASERQRTMRLIERGLRLGWLKPWEIPPSLAEAVPAGLASLLQTAIDEGNARVATRAADVLCRMARHNLDLAVAVDHAARLDGGEATQRDEVTLRVDFPRPPERQMRIEP